MQHIVRWMVGVGLGLGLGTASVWAHSEHEHGATGTGSVAENSAQEQTLTGEVVDVFCYLSHGAEGLGPKHAGCAKRCIKDGLPVAIKVGDQLYLAAMANHDPANKSLGEFAGEQVTVHGTVLEKDGQHLLAITKVERAK